MQSKAPKVVDHDPWRDLAAEAAVTNVPLGQVFSRLRVSQQQAGAVRQGLIDELSRLTEAPERKK